MLDITRNLVDSERTNTSRITVVLPIEVETLRLGRGAPADYTPRQAPHCLLLQVLKINGAQNSMTAAAPWRTALLKSLELNKELKYSTFFQLATVRPNGKPANRTMVYRWVRDHQPACAYHTSG